MIYASQEVAVLSVSTASKLHPIMETRAATVSRPFLPVYRILLLEFVVRVRERMPLWRISDLARAPRENSRMGHS